MKMTLQIPLYYENFSVFSSVYFLKVLAFCFLHCPVCSEHRLSTGVTSLVRPGGNLDNYVQKIEIFLPVIMKICTFCTYEV